MSARVRNGTRFTSTVARALRESAVIALALVALVLLIALVSYSPEDPGYTYSGPSTVMHNRIGVVGALTADVLYFLFGWPAFLLPVVLAAAAWGLQRRVRTESGSRVNSVVRVGGFVLLMAASCGLAHLHWQPGMLRQGRAGGVIGFEVGGGLQAGLSFLGATLVLVAAWMAALSLAFGISWLAVMDRLGALAWAALGWLRTRSLSAK
ncbi:MAG: DNA translocase FtsK 4TM domain-containing protein, partial [Steroidobacteraceae bacterium]